MDGNRLIKQILCVALVATVMMPAGTMLFPYLSAKFSGLQFETLEAVGSAALGFGLYALFG